MKWTVQFDSWFDGTTELLEVEAGSAYDALTAAMETGEERSHVEMSAYFAGDRLQVPADLFTIATVYVSDDGQDIKPLIGIYTSFGAAMRACNSAYAVDWLGGSYRPTLEPRDPSQISAPVVEVYDPNDGETEYRIYRHKGQA